MRMRIKDVVTLRNEKTKLKDNYIGLENIISWDAKYIPSDIEPEGTNAVFKSGDILFGKLRPYLAKGFIPNYSGVCSTEFLVMAAKKTCLNKFLLYTFLSPKYISDIKNKVKGVKMPRTSWYEFSSMEIEIPSIKKQEQIVKYLDSKLSEIDSQVNLLTSKRDAYLRLKKSIINHAVTQGLNPEVKMKANGVDWIGEIPEHWEYKRIKDISRQVFMGKTPEYTFKKNKNWIFGQRNNQTYGLDFNDIKYGKDAFFSSRKKFEFLKYGDVLLNTLGGGSVGRVGFYNYKGVEKVITDGHIMVIRCKGYSEKYLYYFLSTKRNALEQMAVGSTNQSFFNISDILILHVPFPPLSEQQAIAVYLDEKCSKIDKIVANLEKQISLYTDMKRSLIDEVITGKRAV
jgi:type I restriction enzyme S subunit